MPRENVKVLVAFSDRDPGRGNAILWLTKHFGVFPIEVSRPTGELNVIDVTEFRKQLRLTLLIQAIPIVEERTYPIGTNSEQIDSAAGKSSLKGDLRYHVPRIKGAKNLRATASLDTLIHQVGTISQAITNQSSIMTGPVIYLAGISIPKQSSYAQHFPSSKFVPWYLLSIDSMAIKRIYRQPELTRFLGKLRVGDPRITDLESIIADMEGDSNYE